MAEQPTQKFVKIGAKNLRFAKLNDLGFVDGDVVSLPGTTQVKVAITSNNATLSADDGPYMSLSSGIEKVTMTISNYFLTPEIKQLILGTTYKKGMEIFDDKTLPNHVAVMYETQLISNAKNPLYVGLLNGTFKFPDSTTKSLGNGAPDPSAEELEGEFVQQERGNRKITEINGFTSDSDFDLATYEKLVFPKSSEDLTSALAVIDGTKPQAAHTEPSSGVASHVGH